MRALAEAIARDPEHTEDVVLAVVGGPSGAGHGEEVVRLMDLAAALGVAERVMLFPPQAQVRLADFYAAADVVLVPSRSESFGLVALEAQACGTPVVAAAVGGLPLRRRGRRRRVTSSRVTTPPITPSACCRCCATRARPPDGRGGSARQPMRFTWDATADEVLGVYRELMATRRSVARDRGANVTAYQRVALVCSLFVPSLRPADMWRRPAGTSS